MNGLKTVVDTIISPKEAFESLRETPTWVWALIALAVTFIIGYEMQRPAALHASVGTMQHMFTTNSFFANMTDAQKAAAMEKAQHPDMLATITGPLWAIATFLIGALFNALFLLIGANVGRGNARFVSLWAASLNISVPTLGLSAIVLGIICLIRGPESFNTTGDLLRSIPSLAMLAPGVTGPLGGMLALLSVFSFWGLWLNMQALRFTAQVTGAMVWVIPVVITLLSTLVGGWLVSFGG